MSNVTVVVAPVTPTGDPISQRRLTVDLVAGSPGAPGHFSDGEIIWTSVSEIPADPLELSLVRNSDITPAGTYYRVRVPSLAGVEWWIALDADTPDSVEIGDPSIQVLSPLPPAPTPGPAIKGDPGEAGAPGVTSWQIDGDDGGIYGLAVTTDGQVVARQVPTTNRRRLFTFGHSYMDGVSASAEHAIPDVVRDGLHLTGDIYDGFERADPLVGLVSASFPTPSTTSLGATDQGVPWTVPVSGDVFGVDGSGQAYTAAIGAGSYHYALVPTIGEGAIRAKITSGAGNVRPGLICKYVDANNFIYVECSNQFGVVYVNKRVAGVTTLIYSSGFGAQGADGRTLRITRTGSSTTGGLVIEVAVNGAVLTTLTVTDAVFDGAGQAGLISLGSTLFTGIRWDDFQQYTPGSGLGAAALIPVGSKAAWRIVDSGTERGAQLFSSGVDVFNNVQVWETGSADKTVTVKLLTDAQDYDAVVVRYKDKDNCLYLQASATYGGWTLVKRIAGVSTNIVDIGGSNRAGAVVKVQVIGDRIRIKTNGSWLSAGGNSGLIQIPTDAMTACGTATRHGFGPVTQRGTYTTVWGWVRFDDSFTLSHAGSKIAFGPTTLGGGGQNDLLQLLPRLQVDDIAMLGWGTNDAIFGGNYTSMGPATVAAISRCLADNVYEGADASVSFAGTWTTNTRTDRNSGTGTHSSSTAGDTVSIVTPAGYNGAPIALGFISSSTAGVVSIQVDAGAATSYNTQPGTPVIYQDVARLTGLTPGVHLITITVISGTIEFDCWQTEGASPAAVLVLNMARFVMSTTVLAPTIYTSTTIGKTGAGWTTNQWVGQSVVIYNGPGVTPDNGPGHTQAARTITANTADTITVSSAFASTPDATSDFLIVDKRRTDAQIWGSITDDDVAAFNAQIAAAVALFPPAKKVRLVDVDAALAKEPTNFSVDTLHPGDIGTGKAGAGIVNVFQVANPAGGRAQGATQSEFDALLSACRRIGERLMFLLTDTSPVFHLADPDGRPACGIEAEEVREKLGIGAVSHRHRPGVLRRLRRRHGAGCRAASEGQAQAEGEAMITVTFQAAAVPLVQFLAA